MQIETFFPPTQTTEKNVASSNTTSPRVNVERKTPPKEEVIGKTFLISTEEGVSVCGNYKLSEELKHCKGVVTILNLIDNHESDKDSYPYIITEIK